MFMLYEQMLAQAMGLAILILAIIAIFAIGIYVLEGIFLTKFNKLVYKKGTPMAWIPIVNLYLLGKLTFNKIVGWILVIALFLNVRFTVTIGNQTISKSLLPDSIASIFSVVYNLAVLGIFIYAIIKYFNLKKTQNSEEQASNLTENTSVNENQSNNTAANVNSPEFSNNIIADSDPINSNNIDTQNLGTLPQENLAFDNQNNSNISSLDNNASLNQSSDPFVLSPLNNTDVLNSNEALNPTPIMDQPVSEPSSTIFNETPVDLNPQPEVNTVNQTISEEPVVNPSIIAEPINSVNIDQPVSEPSSTVFNETPVDLNPQPEVNAINQTISEEPVINPDITAEPINSINIEQPVSEPSSTIFNETPVDLNPQPEVNTVNPTITEETVINPSITAEPINSVNIEQPVSEPSSTIFNETPVDLNPQPEVNTVNPTITEETVINPSITAEPINSVNIDQPVSEPSSSVFNETPVNLNPQPDEIITNPDNGLTSQNINTASPTSIDINVNENSQNAELNSLNNTNKNEIPIPDLESLAKIDNSSTVASEASLSPSNNPSLINQEPFDPMGSYKKQPEVTNISTDQMLDLDKLRENNSNN